MNRSYAVKADKRDCTTLCVTSVLCKLIIGYMTINNRSNVTLLVQAVRASSRGITPAETSLTGAEMAHSKANLCIYVIFERKKYVPSIGKKL